MLIFQIIDKINKCTASRHCWLKFGICVCSNTLIDIFSAANRKQWEIIGDCVIDKES